MTKKIAFVTTSSLRAGGISRVLSILTNELCEIPHYEVHVVSFHPSETTGYFWNKKIVFHELLRNMWGMKRGIIPATKNLRRILKIHGIDILVICGHNVGPLSILSSIFLKTILVYWPHSSFSGYRKKTKYINERINAAFVQVVVSLTKADKTSYLKKTFARKVVQIYNPIDPKLTAIKPSYNPDIKYILSVGRLGEEKNFHSHLVKVAKIVLSRHDDYQWHIYGSGEYNNIILESIKKNNLENKILLKGHSNNIYSVYKDYSVLVMTSQFEGFPMTLLEAMSNGLPLISFDVPTGPNEIIRANCNGYLIEPFDTNAMANKLCKVIEDRNIRTNLSIGSINRIEEFEVSKVVLQWTTLFSSLLDQNSLSEI